MANKQNSLLAKYEAKAKAEARAEYEGQLVRNTEIDLIAHLFSCADLYNIGPGRAEPCLLEYDRAKMDIAKMIVEAVDVDGDEDLCMPKRNIAWKLKHILGPTLWEKYKWLFPIVRDYW